MILLFLFLGVICLWNIKFSNYHEDYSHLKSTNAIKGIFAVLILLSHMNGYITLNNTFVDNSFSLVLKHIGQLMVAMYFFYSGFGIFESIKRKNNYFESFPKNRILKTVLHFDLAVLCYLLFDVIFGIDYPNTCYLTCWIGWDSIGNSNWFVFDIIVLYGLVYISHLIMRNIKNMNIYQGGMVLLSSMFVVILWMFLFFTGKTSNWVDTLLTFPLGMWYSFFRSKIETLIWKKKGSIWVVFALGICFFAWHLDHGNDIFGFCACIFSILIVALSTKIKVDNKILQWLGTQSFAVYIMQRVPMNLFQYIGLDQNPYIFAAISIPSALLIAWGFNIVLNKVDTSFFK